MKLVAYSSVTSAIAVGCVLTPVDATDGPLASGGSSSMQPNPIGQVARSAEEAWPERPADVPVLTSEQIARACGSYTLCAVLEAGEASDPLLLIDFCVAQITWAAERAVPIGSIWRANERAEWFVDCVLTNATDCARVTGFEGCLTTRPAEIYCEEDGCRSTAEPPFSVSCEGDVASLAAGDIVHVRDCSRSFARCDPTSPTGCSDRQFSQCPVDGPFADRCEGEIRLGCDGAGQVSYRDCARMGGTCTELSSASLGCSYTDQPSAECQRERTPASCQSGSLAVCVNGALIVLPAPELCGPG
jgi:hypothetical protein